MKCCYFIISLLQILLQICCYLHYLNRKRKDWVGQEKWVMREFCASQSYWCATCNKEISKLLHLQLINFLLASVWKMCTSCVPLNEYCSWTVSHLWIFQCVCCFLSLWWPASYFLCCSVLGHHSWLTQYGLKEITFCPLSAEETCQHNGHGL